MKMRSLLNQLDPKTKSVIKIGKPLKCPTCINMNMMHRIRREICLIIS